MDHRVADLA